MKIYNLLQDSSLIKSVRKFSWNRGIPGGWLKYGPPRMVCAYGDGSLYTDDGEKYGKNYKETAWAGAIPLNQSTLVVKTKPFPKNFLRTGILKDVRDILRDYGADVGDHSCSGIWCNYYNQKKDIISAHTDDEDYYERNYGKHNLFVSLTLYEDENKSYDNLTRFQIKEKGKWKTVDLPHMSLLVMAGDIEHRVVMNEMSRKFRKRYNITFRTPYRMQDDIIKNWRFFSNFGRYYNIPYKLYIPNEDKKYDKIVDSFLPLV